MRERRVFNLDFSRSCHLNEEKIWCSAIYIPHTVRWYYNTVEYQRLNGHVAWAESPRRNNKVATHQMVQYFLSCLIQVSNIEDVAVEFVSGCFRPFPWLQSSPCTTFARARSRLKSSCLFHWLGLGKGWQCRLVSGWGVMSEFQLTLSCFNCLFYYLESDLWMKAPPYTST